MSVSDVLTTRPLKRTRLSTDDEASSQSLPSSSSLTAPSPLKRHPEIWFDDGNLVLVAQGTAFRIYRGLLAGQSTVFSDMFVSSTTSPDEIYDGCPVVYLSDSPHDLAHLLRVLLPKSHIHYHPTRAPTFDEISAVIRLAHKYNIPQVEEQALVSLRENAGLATSFAEFCKPPPRPQIVLQLAQFIGAVNLARLTNTPSLLPLALYHCVFLGSAALDGWTHEDGSVEHLPDGDLRRCIDAAVTLTDERTLLISNLFDSTPGDDCTGGASCVEKLRQFHDHVMRSDITRQVPPLYDWKDAIRVLEKANVPCQPCREELLARNERERNRIFDSLPTIFGITVDGWGVAEAEAAPAAPVGPAN